MNTEPRTEAGQAMLRDQRAWWARRDEIAPMIIAIEAEASKPDGDRLARIIKGLISESYYDLHLWRECLRLGKDAATAYAEDSDGRR